FFSSRRRHTRLVSDWSSDVCSSALLEVLPPQGRVVGQGVEALAGLARGRVVARGRGQALHHLPRPGLPPVQAGVGDRVEALAGRSEERRVGEGWRSRGATWT